MNSAATTRPQRDKNIFCFFSRRIDILHFLLWSHLHNMYNSRPLNSAQYSTVVRTFYIIYVL
jgi:hypothetical protein